MDIRVHESCRVYRRLFHTPSETAARLFYYPQWAGYFSCNPDFYIRRHSFDSLLLIKTESGQGKMLYRGGEYLLDREHMALIDCRELHEYYPISQEAWDFRFLHFSGALSREMYAHIFEQAGSCVFPGGERLGREMEQCMEICRMESESQEALLSQCIGNLLHDILLQARKGEQDGIANICRYIARHYAQPLSTEQLARMACFSRCYFSTAFKKHTGMTLHEYLICRRLDRAKELLCQGNMTVSAIGEKVGFGDTGTFIRVFRRKEKMTPLQYRKIHFAPLVEEEKRNEKSKENSNIYVK